MSYNFSVVDPWKIKSLDDFNNYVDGFHSKFPSVDLSITKFHVCSSEFKRLFECMSGMSYSNFRPSNRQFNNYMTLVKLISGHCMWVNLCENKLLNGTRYDPATPTSQASVKFESFDDTPRQIRFDGLISKEDAHQCTCKSIDLFRNGGCTCRYDGQKEVPWALEVYGK